MISVASSSDVIKSEPKQEYKLDFTQGNVAKTKQEFFKRVNTLLRRNSLRKQKPIAVVPKQNSSTFIDELEGSVSKEMCHRKESLFTKLHRRKTEPEFHVPFATKQCFVCICNASSCTKTFQTNGEKVKSLKPWKKLQRSRTEPRLFKYHLLKIPSTVHEADSKENNNNNIRSQMPCAKTPKQKFWKQIQRRNTEPLFKDAIPRLITSKLVRSRSLPGKDSRKMVVVGKVVYFEEEDTVIEDGFLTTDLCSTEL